MANLQKKYGSPYYDQETNLWNQRYNYVDENGKVWGISSIDKAKSLDLLDSVLTEDYLYGKPIGAALNALSWGFAGASYLGTPGAITGGLLGAANGYTGLPGMLLSNEGIKACRNLDNLKINGVNVNPVEYENPAAQLRAYERRKDRLEPHNVKRDLLADYQYPSRAFYAMERNFAVDKNNYAGPSQEISPQDVMNAEENAHVAALGRAHLNAKRAETYFAGEFVSAEENRKARAKASRASAAPTTDVITAEDGHLIGFAERHGLGWRDVWELNKETIPNPNAVQAGTTLNLPNRRSVNKAQAPDASAPMTTQAAPTRRAQRQSRLAAGGYVKDYVSAGPQKRTPNRNANTAGFNMDFLSTSANKAARGDYSVTLGGWSAAEKPRTGSPGSPRSQRNDGLLSSTNDAQSVDARTDRQLAQQARQAAAAKVQANQDQAPRATDEEEALVSTPSPARRARVEKLGESAATTSLANQNDLTSDPANAASGPANQGARAANAYAHARANAATTAKKRGAARHEAAIRTANGQDTARYGEKGNVLDSNGDTVGVSFDRFGRATSVGGQKVNANQTNQARNKDGTYSFDADGNGAGDAGGTVICTELYRQGLIDKHVYRADQRFGLRLLRNDPDVIAGYHFWAQSVVQLMRKSPLFTRIVYKSVGEAWAREMALREGLNGIGTVRGKLVIAIGIPVCRAIGRALTALRKGASQLA